MRRRIGRGAIAAAAGLAVAWGGFAAPVSAGSLPTLQVDPTTINAGGTVNVSMNCWGTPPSVFYTREGIDVPITVDMNPVGNTTLSSQYSGSARIDAGTATADFDAVFSGRCSDYPQSDVTVRVLVDAPATTTTVPATTTTEAGSTTTTAAVTGTTAPATPPAVAPAARPLAGAPAYTG